MVEYRKRNAERMNAQQRERDRKKQELMASDPAAREARRAKSRAQYLKKHPNALTKEEYLQKLAERKAARANEPKKPRAKPKAPKVMLNQPKPVDRTLAALAACEGIPTELLSPGILLKLSAYLGEVTGRSA